MEESSSPDSYLEAELEENDGIIVSEENVKGYRIPLVQPINDSLGKNGTQSLLEKTIVKRKVNPKSSKVIKKKHTIKKEEDVEEKPQPKRPTVRKNINRKYNKMVEKGSINSKKSNKCVKEKRCKNNRNRRNATGTKHLKNSKNSRIPIKPHNVVYDEEEEEEEDNNGDNENEEEKEVSTKKRLNPKIKEFAITAANKIAEHGIPLATNVAKDFFNNQKNVSTEQHNPETDSNPKDELSDLIMNSGKEKKDNNGDNDSNEDETEEYDDNISDYGIFKDNDSEPSKRTKKNEYKMNKNKNPVISKKRKNISEYEDDSNYQEKYKPPKKSNKEEEEVEMDDNGDNDGEEEKVVVEGDDDENENKDEFEFDSQDNDNLDEDLNDPSDDIDDNNGYNDDEEEEIEEDDEEYTKRFKTPSGLEYLGAGYDLIKGNPLGDNITLLDPGYKSSVIQMHWNKNIENISNSLEFLQPIGGWIRPYSSCHKVETITEIKSSDTLRKSLSADASVSLNLPGDALKFSASAKFKRLDDASKSGNTKMFMNKSYCFKYVAGISTSLKWDFTLGFQASLERLLDKFDGLDKESSCQPYIYRQDPKNERCEEMGITDWMELFKTFGTHVATKIYLGGKILTTIEVKKTQEKMLTDQGMDVKAMLSAQIKDTTIDSNVKVSAIKYNNSGESLLNTKKSTFVLGGDIYGHGETIDFGEWSKSVSEHSMPIKAEFTPIFHFIDKNLKDAYNNAYLYYGKVILESDFLKHQSQMELSLEEMMNEIDIEHSQGVTGVKATCKDGKLIQFGFMIISYKDKTHEIKECPIHNVDCSAPENENIIHSTLWVACRSQNIINLKQIVTKDENVSCDSGFNILLGSYFFGSKSNYLLMKPCKLGNNTCETDGKIDYTWLVCTKKFWDLNSKSKVVKRTDSSSITCKDDETIVFGFGFEWIKNKDRTTFARFISCNKDEPTCSHKCSEFCNRITQYIICK